MELKLDGAGIGSRRVKGFNRTFMELKYGGAHAINQKDLVLIVPLWN